MATSGGGNYRNGTHKSSMKVDRSLSLNSNPKSSVKSKSLPSSGPRRNSTGSLAGGAAKDNAGVPGRVRVAVRLRPRNAEELVEDADFADCVELQPELKRLKLRKNNWDSDTYEFDEVLTEFASQKRVYEVVAKPVVESVLDGYNGTIMAYGQTGTGKTYTLGRLGEEDTAARGIMVRAMEDILADVSLETDSVSVSYLQVVSLKAPYTYMQLYMETIQDLLDPANDNIPIVEDPKTGDVSVPGATLVEIRDQHSFVELLRLGEAHRFAANTKLNTESSRSHAILMVHVKRSVKARDSAFSSENGNSPHMKTLKPSLVRKGKLVVVDLAGSERIDKSGSEGHTLEEAKSINLSLSALGKCINALAENSAHVPVRTARTSLVITIGPSPRHRGETASTIMFGQRKERLKYQKDYMDSIKKLEEQLVKNQQKNGSEKVPVGLREDGSALTSNTESSKVSAAEEVAELKKLLQKENLLRKTAEEEVNNLKSQIAQWKRSEASGNSEILKLRKMLEDEASQKEKLEGEIAILQSQLLQLSFDADETTRRLDRGGSGKVPSSLDSLISQVKHHQKDSGNGEKASIAKLFEQVGLQKILSLLEAEDADVRIHAVKVVANLAAEEMNQEKIVEAGGLTSLLMLLRNSEDETIHRVAAGAIANLAMNGAHHVSRGIGLLSMTAANAEDPQTLRMVAGAIANLCGNDKLQMKLRIEGGIKALLGMVRCRHADVLAQVARGIANFAKCESRAATQGTKTGRSLLIEDGALPWIVQNANNEASPIRRHIELALCHLAQHGISKCKRYDQWRCLWELVRISRDCAREDVRTLSHRTLTSSPTFQAEMRRLRIGH
ncbi:kinesin-like protein kin-ua [Quercus suber]|uniref:Kinesin-like protein n=1 Tax=Quercus suber TaxID=58331 RepID=A0AAW0J5Q2_QUESU